MAGESDTWNTVVRTITINREVSSAILRQSTISAI